MFIWLMGDIFITEKRTVFLFLCSLLILDFDIYSLIATGFTLFVPFSPPDLTGLNSTHSARKLNFENWSTISKVTVSKGNLLKIDQI